MTPTNGLSHEPVSKHWYVILQYRLFVLLGLESEEFEVDHWLHEHQSFLQDLKTNSFELGTIIRLQDAHGTIDANPSIYCLCHGSGFFHLYVPLGVTSGVDLISIRPI